MFDYLTEYSRHRSLNKLAELTGLSRNTVKARILAAGGTIRPRDGNNGRPVKYCHFSVKIDKTLSDHLTHLAAKTGLEKSEIVRKAIAQYLQSPTASVKPSKSCIIILNVWVTPETLVAIDALEMGRAEIVRSAIKGLNMAQVQTTTKRLAP